MNKRLSGLLTMSVVLFTGSAVISNAQAAETSPALSAISQDNASHIDRDPWTWTSYCLTLTWKMGQIRPHEARGIPKNTCVTLFQPPSNACSCGRK